MTEVWSARGLQDAAGNVHPQAALACPRCGRVTLVELVIFGMVQDGNDEIHDADEVVETGAIPSPDDLELAVKHLPEDIQRFFGSAQRALLAGIPDAAAVQLRKTLEAAAAKKGIEERNLFNAVKKLLDENYLTQDFAGLLDYVRNIGNIGAHYNDTVLDAREVERSVRFTTQVLRNLFEVPGELEELRIESETDVDAGPDEMTPKENSF